MKFMRLYRSYSAGLVAVLLIACGNLQDPARHAVENVDAAVSAVAASGQKYQPEQFTALQVRATALKASFDKGDYKQVLADAPTLLNDAQALGAAAAAKEDKLLKSLAGEWSALAASVPDKIAAVQARIDVLSTNKKDAAKFNLPAAKASMADVGELWSKAQDAFSAGHLEAAVSAARNVQSKVEATATSLKLELPTAH